MTDKILPKILIVDEDERTSDDLSSILSSNYSPGTAIDGASGLKLLGKGEYSVAFLELKLLDIDGIEFIKKASIISPETVFIVLSSESTVDNAVRGTKGGAYNFLAKPYTREAILLNARKACEYHGLLREERRRSEERDDKYSFDSIVGDSDEINKIFSLIGKVANSDSNILILGDSGTGKELIARTTHHYSSRHSSAFVPVNCGAIPSELLESELFGHEKGAFTGAVTSRKGRFERADGGTIFLDEIGELAFPLQVKLLRVLQEREFERVGGNDTIRVDVRVIAATNQDLEKCVKERSFREDLYYRLNVIPINVPSLRERKDDIALLARHFLRKMAAKKRREIFDLTDEVLEVFNSYQWPGNIRELENIIERIVILKPGDGPVDMDDIPDKMKLCEEKESRSIDIPVEGIDLSEILEEIERDYIIMALERVNGIKSRAADLLGLNRTTLIERMKKKGLIQRSKQKSAG